MLRVHVTTAAIDDAALIVRYGDETVIVFRAGLMSGEALSACQLLAEHFVPRQRNGLRAVG